MFNKILVAHRGDGARSARAGAKPNCLVRAAHAGDLAVMEPAHV